jgi:general secretion pathway protein D
MTPRSLLLALATPAALVALAQPALAQHVLNVRDADIRAFIADAARVTGRTFVVDGRVQGRVTVVSERALSRAEYFEIVLSTLRANGLVAIPLPNGSYRIQPLDGAAAQPGRIGTQGANRNAFVTEVVRLRHIDAVAALETLRPLVSTQGSVTANRNANSVVIVDFADNIRRVRALIANIDRDATATRLVTLTNAGAREIAESLTALGAGGAEGGRAAVTVAAIDGSNAIALRGDASAVERFAGLAQELDRRAASQAEIRVYWLRHANAERLLPTLQQLVGGGSDPTLPTNSPAGTARTGSLTGGGTPGGTVDAQATPTPAPAPTRTATAGNGDSIVQRGPGIITRYEGANAIIVAGNADTQRLIGELIRQLDVRRQQVLVEAIIVEIGDNAARQLGVQFLLGGENIPFAATNYSNANPSILTLGAAAAGYELSRQTTTIDGNIVTTTTNNPLGQGVVDAATQQILGATGGFGGLALDIGRNAIFGAILNAVRTDTNSNLLAVPHMVTLDNSPARFLVGQDVPVTTGEALSDNFDNRFRTVQRREVGIKLEITPQINAAGEITLTIRQEVSSVAGPVNSRSSDLIFNTRLFETVLTAGDGQIMAIGGLLNDDERRTIQAIPLLSEVPVIGELFRSRSRARTNTNLMVFIRPTIIRDGDDANAMTARRYNYIRNAQMIRDPEAEPEIDLLVRDYLGTVPPVVAPQPGDMVIGAASRMPDGTVAPVPVPPSDPATNAPADPYGPPPPPPVQPQGAGQ